MAGDKGTAAKWMDPYVGRYRDGFVEHDGVSIHYTDWLTRSASRSLLFVHGTGSQGHSWDPTAAALQDDYHVVNVDLRGHGDSSWAMNGYHTQQFAGDLFELVQALGLAPVAFVGHSLGARVGLAFARLYPDALRALVLSDAGPEISRSGALTIRDRLTKSSDIKGFSDEDGALDFFMQTYPDWQPVFHHLHARYQLRRNWADKLVFKADPDLFWLNGSVSLREVPFLWECAARTKCPTLIVRGRRSYVLSEEAAQHMLRVIPTSSLVEVDCGHYVPRERHEEFLRLVVEFLSTSDLQR